MFAKKNLAMIDWILIVSFVFLIRFQTFLIKFCWLKIVNFTDVRSESFHRYRTPVQILLRWAVFLPLLFLSQCRKMVEKFLKGVKFYQVNFSKLYQKKLFVNLKFWQPCRHRPHLHCQIHQQDLWYLKTHIRSSNLRNSL